MAARSEAEANSLLVYKSPAWKGGVLYSLLRFTRNVSQAMAGKAKVLCCTSDGRTIGSTRRIEWAQINQCLTRFEI
jgi:hypothetical protein